MQLGIHDNEKLHGIIRIFEKSSLRTRFLNASSLKLGLQQHHLVMSSKLAQLEMKKSI